MEETKKYIAPEHESFHFGIYHCAYCLGMVSGPSRRSYVVKLPSYESEKGSPVVIPSGRQSFHSDCLTRFKYDLLERDK